MMPDLLAWLLTGRRVGERTNASTTQLLDPRTGRWYSHYEINSGGSVSDLIQRLRTKVTELATSTR